MRNERKLTPIFETVINFSHRIDRWQQCGGPLGTRWCAFVVLVRSPRPRTERVSPQPSRLSEVNLQFSDLGAIALTRRRNGVRFVRGVRSRLSAVNVTGRRCRRSTLSHSLSFFRRFASLGSIEFEV